MLLNPSACPLLPPPPDEPTSGLDARGAGLVMRAVKATVDTGRIVVCTIHQASRRSGRWANRAGCGGEGMCRRHEQG